MRHREAETERQRTEREERVDAGCDGRNAEGGAGARTAAEVIKGGRERARVRVPAEKGFAQQ